MKDFAKGALCCVAVVVIGGALGVGIAAAGQHVVQYLSHWWVRR